MNSAPPAFPTASVPPTTSALKWTVCRKNNKKCRISTHLSHEAHLKVPSDHIAASSGHFHLYAQKFQRANTIPTVHLVFLAGGPGGIGRSYDGFIDQLLQLDGRYACYTVDHRGLGRSGLITNDSYREIVDSLDHIVKRAPFPLRSLTLTNSALDVALLADAIKEQSDWRSGSQIALYGYSYGAQLAHHIVELRPNLFNQAFILGIPPLKSLKVAASHQGPVEMCERDAECRRLMGGDVAKQIRHALLNISKPEYNECTRKFYSIWSAQPHAKDTQGDIMTALIWRMRSLIINRAPGLNRERNLRTVQVVLAAIKATSDCEHPESYTKDVLVPLQPYMDGVVAIKENVGNDEEKNERNDGRDEGQSITKKVMEGVKDVANIASVANIRTDAKLVDNSLTNSLSRLQPQPPVQIQKVGNTGLFDRENVPNYETLWDQPYDEQSEGRSNEMVNTVVFIDKDYDFDTHPPSRLHYHVDLTPSVLYPPTYHARWKFLRPHLTGTIKSQQRPIHTSYTHLHMANGRMDMITTYAPAYARFTQAQAPVKSWMLLDRHDHDGLYSPCLFLWLNAAVEKRSMEEVEACVKESNAIRLDWSFQSYPQFQTIWKQVKSASKVPIEVSTSSIPSFVRSSNSLTRQTTKGSPDYRLLLVGGSIVLFMLVGLAWFFRKRRSRSSSGSLANGCMRVLLARLAEPLGRKVTAPLTESCQKQTKELCDFVQRYFRVSKVYRSPSTTSLIGTPAITVEGLAEHKPRVKMAEFPNDPLINGGLRDGDGETPSETLDCILKNLTKITQVPDDTGIPVVVARGNILTRLLGSLTGKAIVPSYPDLYMVTFHKEQATRVQRIWSDSGPLKPSNRPSARAILLNPKRDAVYMFELVDPHMVTSSIIEHRLWFTPGGGMDPNEDLYTVLERELWEELSLKPTEFRVLGHLWTGRTSMIWKGLPHTFIDNYFLVELTSNKNTFGRGNLMEDEVDVLRSGRWWPLEELATTEATIVPSQLRDLCKMDLSIAPCHSNIGESV
ncbi:Exopolyphosphatase [Paramicrosporidium saccamoebae]|uniref:Exopolyphosphatase n=1 Tax=Paramicrosporidium saccamoebae TaxID=1246581 RepID=A0A2H9TK63_9FUNG|nr:Exopolyphosphatase [Paramicrosporidium saccamoebae]